MQIWAIPALGGAWGTLRPETPEDLDISKGIKRREVEDVRTQTNSFNICLKISLISNTKKWGVRKVRKGKILLAYLLKLLTSCFNTL